MTNYGLFIFVSQFSNDFFFLALNAEKKKLAMKKGF